MLQMCLTLVQALALLKSLIALFQSCWANEWLIRLDLSILFRRALSRWKSFAIYSVDFTYCGGNRLPDLQCKWCRFGRHFFDHCAVYSVCNFLIIFHINMYMVLF